MKIVIAIVAAAALAAVLGAVWVGSRTFERTVVADPYESGIHHDADRRKAEALGWIIGVDEGSLRAGPEATLAVRLTGRDGAPLEDAEVLFRVSRAGTSRFDCRIKGQQIRLSRDFLYDGNLARNLFHCRYSLGNRFPAFTGIFGGFD